MLRLQSSSSSSAVSREGLCAPLTFVRAESEEEMKPKREALAVGVVCCEGWLRGVLEGVVPGEREIEPLCRRALAASAGDPGSQPLSIPLEVGDWAATLLSPVNGISTRREPSGPLMEGDSEDEGRGSEPD